MKYFFYCLLAVISYCHVQAQDTALNTNRNLSAHLIDSLSGAPVSYASVQIKDVKSGKQLFTARADSTGYFQITLSSLRGYSIGISAIGYAGFVANIPAGSTVDLPETIKLTASSASLAEVTVIAKKRDIESDIDKLIYHVENDLTSSAGDASDVLRKTPMITVDPEGNISVRGNPNPRILLNGKISSLFMRNISDALKSIPASEISRIEIITNPSARYDGDGGSEIINIVTKKSSKQGMNGNINLSMSNLKNNGGVNLTFKKNELLFFTSINGNFSFTRKRPGTYERQDFVYKSSNKQESVVFDRRRGLNASAGVDYSWNKHNQLQSSIGFNTSRDIQQGYMTGSIADSNLNRENFTRTMNAPGTNVGIDYYLDYTHRFRQEDKVLSFAFLINKNDGNSGYVSDLQFDHAPYFLSEKADKKNQNIETTFQGDFSSRIGKGKLEIGAKTIIRNFSNDFKVYNYDDSTNSMMLNPNRTNLFQFKQHVYAGYIQYAIKLSEKITLRAGSRAEFAELTTVSNNFQQTPSVRTSYFNLLPSIALAKSIGTGNQQIKISYSKRLQRLGTDFLNPFISASDSYNRTKGNPYLEPEILHGFELGYSISPKNNFYGMTAFYRITNNAIGRYAEISYDTITGNNQGAKGTVSTTTYDNIGRSGSWGVNLTASISVFKNLNIRSNWNINTNSMNTVADKYHFTASSVSYTVFSMNVNASLRLKKGVSLESFFTARTPQKNIQGQSNGFTLFNAAVRKNIFQDAGSIGLIITEPFRKGTKMSAKGTSVQFYEYTEVLTPNRSVAVSFTLNLGKLKSKSNSKKINNDDLK